MSNMKNYEMPIWYGHDNLSRIAVYELDERHELLISFTSKDAALRMSLPLETAELLAANILTAIRASQLREAA